MTNDDYYLMDYVHEHPDEFDFHRAQDIPLMTLMYKLFTGTNHWY